MEVDTTLSIEDMKKISHEIIDEELRKFNIELKVLPLTFIEYYNEYIFNKKYSLIKKINLSKMPLISEGFNDLKGNTVIFLNRIHKIEKIEQKIFRLVEVCYHEARHSMQQKFDDYSSLGFFLKVDAFLKENTNYKDYILEHDKYYLEIDANIYGVKNAKEYLKNKYPDLYEKYKNEIGNLEIKYQFNYLTYDACDTIERTIQTLKNTNGVWNIKQDKSKRLEKISPVLEIFLNKDASFKPFSEIIQNDKFKELDKKIIFAFFSSKSFLEQVNMNQLSIKELEIINESLQYTSSFYKNQSKLLDQSLNEENISYLEYLKSQKNLIKKISTLSNYYTKKMHTAFNIISIYKKKKHIEKLPIYLEENKELIKQIKSKGFLSVTMFYIIGMIISICTIIYLLIAK